MDFFRYILSALLMVSVVSCGGDEPFTEEEQEEQEEQSFDDFTPLTEVIDYSPAPGQFVSADYCDYGDTATALARLSTSTFVSLGAWGGSITVGFGSPIYNESGYDILIKGNPFVTSSEPGVVWVSADGDSWYEIAGSESSNAETTRSHSIYYSEYDRTYTGTKLPNNAVELTTDYWSMTPFEWGYVDNYSDVDLIGGYNAIEIDNAINDEGDHVALDEILYVKVVTGVEATAGQLGEVSTEVLHLKARTVPSVE